MITFTYWSVILMDSIFSSFARIAIVHRIPLKFDQFNWRNAIPTSHVESVPRSFIKGQSNFRWWTLCSDSPHWQFASSRRPIFPDICKLAMTGKRHRKPFVDKWGKLLTLVNIRMQLFDIGAIFYPSM
ncbi:hypothetical protein DERF_014016 [Dermatophagoides farinae]|uniref:Uncharacterized protein n=1 Tax=Dermatophagoides farinae TaxID=6954 RepID=A0A922HNR3_DERFA|nr:hypothetical protein DERF_014016 [Dermatophagoides farinae]